MHPVVVARREVDRRVRTVVKLRRARTVTAQEFPGREVASLGLENAVSANASALADYAIRRAHKIRIGERSRASGERAGEKRIEGRVVIDPGRPCFIEIDTVVSNKAANYQ